MSEPIYKQLIDKLITEINSMEANSPFYSERELAKKANVSRMTARKVITILNDQGLIYKVGNLGSFVSAKELVKQPTPTFPLINDALEFIKIYSNWRLEDAEIVKKLNISLQDNVYSFRFLTKLNGKPYSIEEIYFEYSKHDSLIKIISNQNLIKQLKEVLETKTLKQTANATIVPIKYFNLLEVEMNAPILLLETLVYSVSGEVHFLCKSYLHPENAKLEI